MLSLRRDNKSELSENNNIQHLVYKKKQGLPQAQNYLTALLFIPHVEASTFEMHKIGKSMLAFSVQSA